MKKERKSLIVKSSTFALVTIIIQKTMNECPLKLWGRRSKEFPLFPADPQYSHKE